MVDKLLLTTTQISTFDGERPLSKATGFFFEREGRLYLITNRHVMIDEPNDHRPSHIELVLHQNLENMVQVESCPLPIYNGELPLWKEATDAGGLVDVVALPIDRSLLPAASVFEAFTPQHVIQNFDGLEIGAALVIVGFPLGFQDTLHNLPIGRQASVASAFGIRFQGQGTFLTDARMHRGASGSPVVARVDTPKTVATGLPWQLLGVHASRYDMGTRDAVADEALGLNAAWYSDVLLVLTEELAPPAEVMVPTGDAPDAQLQPIDSPSLTA